jgi:hypothetical protein
MTKRIGEKIRLPIIVSNEIFMPHTASMGNEKLVTKSCKISDR